MTPQRPTLRAVTGAPETAAQRAARQSAEARTSAAEALRDALADMHRAAESLKALKDLQAIPEAIRHQADLWAADCEVRGLNLQSLIVRAKL